ncbi:YigZ family protein [Ferrimonas gelatinilytica]|uniref:IMPACT family protein n=1 Tax=Ferrimonas gelatinilytica TaxID=1255257 RepID=A0ABP9SCI4_9GAMM
MKVEPFPVPAEPVEVEETIKRSRFITRIERVERGEQARAMLTRLREAHPAARHHCLAFAAGRPGCTRDIGASDDGEPAGSAGRPMLNVLLGSGVGQLAAVVIRYSGGIKLGVGGLVRAYGGGVKLALAQLVTEPFVPMVSLSLSCDYSDLALITHQLERAGGAVLAKDYRDRIHLTLNLPQRTLAAFSQALSDGSRGRLMLMSSDGTPLIR